MFCGWFLVDNVQFKIERIKENDVLHSNANSS
jgi:hypothetical protein